MKCPRVDFKQVLRRPSEPAGLLAETMANSREGLMV
jgi:hypothetical protein